MYNSQFMGKLTKYLDKRSRSQSKVVVYTEGSDSFSGGIRVYRKAFTSQTTITVDHGFGRYPFVQVLFDNGDGTMSVGTHILYDTNHATKSQVVITVGVAASGVVICMSN